MINQYKIQGYYIINVEKILSKGEMMWLKLFFIPGYGVCTC